MNTPRTSLFSVFSGSRPRGLASFLFGLTLATTTAVGAWAVTVPRSVDPGQAQKRFAPLDVSPSRDAGISLPGAEEETSPATKAQLAKKIFVLKSVVIEGVTVYTQDELRFAYEDKLGKSISLAEAQDIARNITNFYRKNGYVLSQAVVPEQEVGTGVLKIRVVEGYISHIEIQGEIKSDSERAIIATYGNKIEAARPARIQDIERYMLLMNDLSGATVTGLIRPSKEFASADLVLTVNKKSYDGGYAIDNRGTKLIGPWQHTLTFGANSLFGRYDRTQVQLMEASADRELLGYEIQHEELVGSEGTKVGVLVSHVHTKPGGSVKSLEIVGDSDLYEAKVSHPFIRSRQQNLVGRAIFDVRDTHTDIFNDVYFSEDRLRVARVGMNYNVVDGWRGNNIVDTQVSKGLNILDASKSGVDRSNANGASDFTKVTADIARLQSLPYNFSILASASGQYSCNSLLVAEQFAIGGADYGQAYDPSELLGDNGIAAKLEVRYTDVVGMPHFRDYQIFTNYDVGKTWLKDASSDVNDKTAMTSVNAGVRFTIDENFSGSLQGGIPLTKDVTNEGDRDSRVFMSLAAHF